TDSAWHLERAAAFNVAPSVVIEKRRKGRIVVVDLKSFAREVTVDPRPRGDGAHLSFVVDFAEGGATVRPEEILIGLYGFLPRGCAIVREELRFGTQSAPVHHGAAGSTGSTRGASHSALSQK